MTSIRYLLSILLCLSFQLTKGQLFSFDVNEEFSDSRCTVTVNLSDKTLSASNGKDIRFSHRFYDTKTSRGTIGFALRKGTKPTFLIDDSNICFIIHDNDIRYLNPTNNKAYLFNPINLASFTSTYKSLVAAINGTVSNNQSNNVSYNETQIEYFYEDPNEQEIEIWKNTYGKICANSPSVKNSDLRISSSMLKEEPCLVYLIINSRAMKESGRDEQQEWLDNCSLLIDNYTLQKSKESVYKLYNILLKEQYKYQQIERKYESSQNRTFSVNGIQFTMVNVEGGTFQMGSNDGHEDERPVHSVTLDNYSIGQTEVTQELWLAVMGNNPSKSKGNKRPVESVSWNDCQKFISKLNSLTGQKFRLPTEAEWEFAARGSIKT